VGDQTERWRGRGVVDHHGEPVGTVADVYLDRQSGEPQWALVDPGEEGSQPTFVPLAGASHAGEDVSVPFARAEIESAPAMKTGQQSGAAGDMEASLGATGASQAGQASVPTARSPERPTRRSSRGPEMRPTGSGRSGSAPSMPRSNPTAPSVGGQRCGAGAGAVQLHDDDWSKIE